MDLRRILPMYVAAYAVILCALASYVSTYEAETFGARGYYMALAGMGVSLFFRWRNVRQNTVNGILAGLLVALLVWGTVSGSFNLGAQIVAMAGDRANGTGMVLAWLLIVCAFAMVSDDVVVFSVVPSIALLGTVASENLNVETVIYFLGVMTGAVFLLVYESLLSRGAVDRRAVPEAASADDAAEGGVEPAVRVSLLLTSVVGALALAVGFVASLPLSYLGQTISEHTPNINLRAASQFAASVANQYVNQLNLDGAPPHLSDRVVLQVRAPRPLYWRGKVFNRYTGYSWTSDGTSGLIEPASSVSHSDGERQWRFPEQVFNLPALEPGREDLGRETVLQAVRLHDPPVAGMLVAAAEPVQFRIHRRRLYVDTERGISTSWPDNGGTLYTVVSRVSVATPDQLRLAGTDYPEEVRARFMDLEGDAEGGPSGRKALAESITAPYGNPYDKVKALESYLRDNYEYSLTPPRPPRGEDAVNHFLTESRQGYCEIFASSMAVLAREVGIPARLATGFAPGEWQPGTRGEWGVALVREKDMHAWTEIYFPDYGWVEFDPTSSREARTGWGTSFRSFLQTLMSQLSRYRTGPLLVMIGMGAILLFLAKSYGLDRLRASVWWRALLARYRRDLSADARWDVLYARAHRRLRRWAPKAAHQTPFEYAAQVRPALTAEAAHAFDALTDLYVARSYQRGGPDAHGVAELVRWDDALRRALRRKPEAAVAPAAA